MKNLSCDLNEFHNLLENSNCICFGAGLQAKRMICILDNWNLSNRLISFIDNDKKRCGDYVKELDYRYPIISIEEAKKMDKTNLIGVITCMDILGIKNQLNTIREFDDLQVTSLEEVAGNQLLVSDYDCIIRNYETAVIPKKLHYCWFGNDMPDVLKQNVDGWKRLCPDYDIICWNEKNYDVTKNKYMYEAYQDKAWGFVPDYARLDIIYTHGGIYLDTDIELLKRPDELLYQDAFGVFDASLLLNIGGGFGARKGFSLIRELRDDYEGRHFKENGLIDKTPCTTLQYRLLRDDIVINDSVQEIRGMNVYPMIMQSANAFLKKKRITTKSFWVHYGAFSWMSDSQRKQRISSVETFNINGLCNY